MLDPRTLDRAFPDLRGGRTEDMVDWSAGAGQAFGAHGSWLRHGLGNFPGRVLQTVKASSG